MKALEILLTYGCNEKCLFCSQDLAWRAYEGLPFELVARQLYAARADGFRSVCFTGGEPTARKDLPQMIALARKLGYDYVRVQTNAVRLADREYASSLIAAGATYFRCSIHGHSAAMHDDVVGLPGALAKALKGVENVREKAGAGINVVINKTNVRALPGICADFLDRGLDDFVLIFPLYEGDMAVHEAEMRVSMAEAAPFVGAAFEEFEKRSAVLPRLLNFTPCALPGRTSSMLSWSAASAFVVDEKRRPVDLYMASHDDRTKPTACGNCTLNAECLGFKTSYIRRFPDERLEPLKARPSFVRAAGGGTSIMTEEDAAFGGGRTEIARAIFPVPETGGKKGPLVIEQLKVFLDPARKRIDEERVKWTLQEAAPHA